MRGARAGRGPAIDRAAAPPEPSTAGAASGPSASAISAMREAASRPAMPAWNAAPRARSGR